MVEQFSAMPAWKLLDRLRAESPLDSQEFIQGLTALIFLRWADFQEAELEAIAAFDDIEYEPVLPPSLHWRTWHSLPPEELSLVLSKLKTVTFHQLYNSRNNPLATHLHHLAGSIQILEKLPPNFFHNLIEWLAGQPFETPADRRQLLDTFDEILQNNQDNHRGEFRTPNHVVRLMVALAAPARGESVYDPCFGSAGLLTGAIDYASQKSEPGKVRYDQTGLQISGIEQNESAYIVGLTRLVLAGCDDPQLEHNNSLLRPPLANPSKEGFDVVLANPPWGWTARMDERYGLEHYPVMTKDGTGLFIQHALSNLRPNGRAVVAVPNGILFRGGAEQKLREWLIAHHTVEAVVSLPETTFGSSTAIKASLLVLRRGGTTRRIRMVEADTSFEKGKGRQLAMISESQLDELVGKVRAARPSESSWDIEVETLVETNYDLTPRRRDQSGLGDIIASLGSSVEIVRLKDCCREIILGRQIRAADLVDELPSFSRSAGQQKLFAELEPKTRQHSLFKPVEPIPFIRIKDINKGQANKGSSWVSPGVASGVEGHWKLRAGDVLLSKSGTIGKVGVVRNGAVGAVAASGLYVLRTVGDRLDPHYLAAYLDSADGKAWLQDRASGGVISHLTKRIIEDLPVPLPPLQIQHQVATMWREHGEDALASLARLVISGGVDPISEKISQYLKQLPDDPESLSNPLDLTLLEKISDEIQILRNDVNHGRIESKFTAWITSFNKSISSLRGIGDIPQGPALLSILQESAFGVITNRNTIEGHLPDAEKARKFADIFERWLWAAIGKLHDSVKLVFAPYNPELTVGKQNEIDIQVQNVGVLPLRNIEISLEPDWGSSSIKFIESGETENLKIKSPYLVNVGSLALIIAWKGQSLDGNSLEGKREITFDVLPESVQKQPELLDLGASPYVCGDPVRPERNDVFFGREELLDQIRRQIMRSGNVVLLEGNRRAGKSSILRHLEGVGQVPGWLGVYCSFQQAAGDENKTGIPTVEIFRLITKELSKSIYNNVDKKIPLPDGEIPPQGAKLTLKERKRFASASQKSISQNSAFSDFNDYIEFILETLAEYKLNILLMLDEFDKLQEGIDNGVTSPQVPENIRFLVQTYPGFSAILTGSRRLKKLREEYWSALFGLGTRFGVTSLSPEAAGRLVTEPVKGRLVYSQEAIDKAIMLTNRQPFLLQSLCNRVFDMAAQLKIRSITLDVIEEAASLLADDNEHFRSLWSYAETDRRRFILGLIHKEFAGPDLLRFGFLLELLSSHGVEVDEEALSGDLEFLRELELIDLVGESVSGHYVLAIPLMGKWIGRQHDFEVLRNKARMETEENHG